MQSERRPDMDVGTIASLSTYMSQATLMQNFSTAVLDMSMESAGAMGDSVAAIMESDVNPAIGSNIDLYA